MKTNILQVFTQASLHLGVSTAHALAQSIKKHSLSKFFPVCNTGVRTDIMAQESAAQEHGLIPRYGRTLFFRSDPENIDSSTPFRLAPITIYAKTLAGRDWLYQQPDKYRHRHHFIESIKEVGAGDVLVFLPDIWLTNDNTTVDARLVREHHPDDTYVAINQTLGAFADKKSLEHWGTVFHQPICAAYEAEVDDLKALHKTNGLHKKAPYLSFSPQDTTNPNFFSGRAFREKIQQLTAEHTGNKENHHATPITVDTLFSQCNEIPTVRSLFLSSDEGTNFLPSSLQLSMKNRLSSSLDVFLEKKDNNTLLERYNNRFWEEFELIKQNKRLHLIGETFLLLSIAEQKNIRLYARDHLTNSLIFHVLGLTDVDPVLNDLPAKPALDPFYFDALAFEVGSNRDIQSLTESLRSDFPGRIVTATRPSKNTATTALKACIMDRWRFNELAKSIFGQKGQSDEDALRCAARSPEQFKEHIEDALRLLPRLSHYETQSQVIMTSSLPYFRYTPAHYGAAGFSEDEMHSLPGTVIRFSVKTAHADREATLNEKDMKVNDLIKKPDGVFSFILKNRFHHSIKSPVALFIETSNPRHITMDDITNHIALNWTRVDSEGSSEGTITEAQKDLLASLGIDDPLPVSAGMLLYKEQLLQLLTTTLKMSEDNALTVLKALDKEGTSGFYETLNNHLPLPDITIRYLSKLIELSGGRLHWKGKALAQTVDFYVTAGLFCYHPTTMSKHCINHTFSGKKTVGAVQKLSIMREFQQCYGVKFGRLHEQTTFKGLQLTDEDGALVPKYTMKQIDDNGFEHLIAIFKNKQH